MSNVKEKEFSTISVYIDEDENMIGIPCGESDKYGIADIDKVVLLKAPYSDSQIENFVEEVISYCYTKNIMIHLRFQLLKSILKKRFRKCNSGLYTYFYC